MFFVFDSVRRSDLCARRGGARHHARHARDDDGPVRPPRHACADRHAIAVRQQYADGEHARVAAISVKTISPTPHFVAFAQAVLFRGADITLLWRPLVAMFAIGIVYFTIASVRFRKVIFGG